MQAIGLETFQSIASGGANTYTVAANRWRKAIEFYCPAANPATLWLRKGTGTPDQTAGDGHGSIELPQKAYYESKNSSLWRGAFVIRNPATTGGASSIYIVEFV